MKIPSESRDVILVRSCSAHSNMGITYDGLGQTHVSLLDIQRLLLFQHGYRQLLIS